MKRFLLLTALLATALGYSQSGEVADVYKATPQATAPDPVRWGEGSFYRSTDGNWYQSIGGSWVIWQGGSGSGITDLIQDTSPQLGGTLDAQGNILDNLGLTYFLSQLDGTSKVFAGFGNINSVAHFYMGEFGGGPQIFNDIENNTGWGFTQLAGSGSRMVVADADGYLSTQAIPSGGGGSDGNDFVNGASLSGTTLTLNVPNQTNPTVDLSALQDGSGTDDQTAAEVAFTPTGNTDATDVQGAIVELQGDINTLSAGGSDGNDFVDGASLSGTTLTLNVPNQTNPTVDLSSLQDGTGTDDQTAAEVAVTDAGGNYTATDVEGILAEIAPQLGAGGAGDFLADGSVPMTGALDIDNYLGVGVTTTGSDNLVADMANIGFTDFNTGQGAKFTFGDDFNGIFNSYGNGLLLSGYHTMYFRQGTTAPVNGNSYPNNINRSFQFELAGNRGLAVKYTSGTYAGNPFFILDDTEATVFGINGNGTIYSGSIGSAVTTVADPYDAGWDGDNSIPAKNDIYDAIQALPTSSDDQTAAEVAVTDAGGNFTATDVEGILAEIAPQLGADTNDFTTGASLSGDILTIAVSGQTDPTVDLSALRPDASMDWDTYQGLTPGEQAAITDIVFTSTDPIANNQIVKGVSTILSSTAGSVTWTGQEANTINLTLTEDTTIQNPSNPEVGAIYQFFVQQDGTGLHTLSWGNQFAFPDGTAPVMTLDPGAVDVYTAYWNGTVFITTYVQNFLTP